MSVDIEETLNRALASKRGIKIEFASESLASAWRQRAYKDRERDRKQDPDGMSEWDELMFTLEGSVLYIRRPGDIALKVEDL